MESKNFLKPPTRPKLYEKTSIKKNLFNIKTNNNFFARKKN